MEEPSKPVPDDDAPWAKGKGPPFSFFPQSFRSFLSFPFVCLFGAPVRFLLLSTQFSVFVRDHLRRKDRYLVEGRLWKGDSPFSIEVGKGVIDLFLNQALLLHCGWKEVLVSGATKGSSSSRNPLNRDWASKLFVYLILPGCETGREVNQVHVMCVHSVPGTFLLAEYGCWS